MTDENRENLLLEHYIVDEKTKIRLIFFDQSNCSALTCGIPSPGALYEVKIYRSGMIELNYDSKKAPYAYHSKVTEPTTIYTTISRCLVQVVKRTEEPLI